MIELILMALWVCLPTLGCLLVFDYGRASAFLEARDR